MPQRKRLELKVVRNERLLADHWHDHWHDRMIDPGDEWDPAIQRNPEEADREDGVDPHRPEGLSLA